MGVFKKIEDEFDFDIVDEFIDHFEIMCMSLEPTIKKLESKEMASEGIEELFRTAHNLKSASGFLKLVTINKFVSFIEEQLEKVRHKDRIFNSETIDWFFLISNQLNDWYIDLAQDKDEFSKIDTRIFNIPQEIDEL